MKLQKLRPHQSTSSQLGQVNEKSHLCGKICTPMSHLNHMTLISDPNLKDVNEDVATVVGPLMQKHGVGFKQHQSEKDQRQMEKQRLICKNKGRIESQREDIFDWVIGEGLYSVLETLYRTVTVYLCDFCDFHWFMAIIVKRDFSSETYQTRNKWN